MPVSSGRFRRVLSRPGVPSLLGAYLLSRLAATTIVLALLLLAQAETHSFAVAGSVSACFAAGTAVAAPLLGRIVDTRGQRLVLATCAVAAPLALVAVVLCLRRDAIGAAVVSAAVAGALLPPVTSCMRTVWPEVIGDDALLDTGWAVESLVVEATELAGPLLAGAVFSLVSPSAALLVAAGLSYAGPMLFALSRNAAGPRSTGSRRPSRLGPLRIAPVRAMLVVILLTTAGLAATEVAITHAATVHHRQGATGVLFAVWLTGSLLGGWLYGRRAWGTPAERLQPLLLSCCALLTVLLTLVPFGVPLATGLFLAGLAVAPATAVQFALMSRIAPDSERTETFTWASTAGFLGLGLGSWVDGLASSSSRVEGHLGWWVAAGFSLLAAGLAWQLGSRVRTSTFVEVALQRDTHEMYEPVAAVGD